MHMELNGPTKDGEQLKTMLLEAEVAISKPLSPFPTPCGHIYRERERAACPGPASIALMEPGNRAHKNVEHSGPYETWQGHLEKLQLRSNTNTPLAVNLQLAMRHKH